MAKFQINEGHFNGEVSLRVDLALLGVLRTTHPEISRARLKELFQNGKITLNGVTVSASHLLEKGVHEIEIHAELPEAPEALASSQGSFVPILFEDENLLILNKPSGIPSAPLKGDEENTVVGSALAHFPSLRGVGVRPLEPGLVHRLDRGTSGALIFAKTGAEFQRLKGLFKEKRIFKLYRAITVSSPGRIPLRISDPLGHDQSSSKKMIVIRSAMDARLIRSKPLLAVTLIHTERALKRGFDIDVEIQTGVMHQIRAHLASRDAPILGDAIYGGEQSSRLWLHAWKLMIPREGRSPLEITASLPEEWPNGVMSGD